MLSSLVLVLQCILLVVSGSQQVLSSKSINDSLLWGAYRPNLYFGTRARLPESLITGLIWSNVEDWRTVQQNLRHTCEQNDGMKGYGWESYDPRWGGTQVIHDTENHVDITTDLVKFPEIGANGGSWAVRVKGNVAKGFSPRTQITTIFYLGLEGMKMLDLQPVDGKNIQLGFEKDLVFKGRTDQLGPFTVKITHGKGSHPESAHSAASQDPLENTRVSSLKVPNEALWQAKSVLSTSMKANIDKYMKAFGEANMPPSAQLFRIPQDAGTGNLQFIQKTFSGDFEYDVIYTQGETAEITENDISRRIKDVKDAFGGRYSKALQPRAPFTASKYTEFSKAIFSNLVGGIGYFYGDQIIDRSIDAEYAEENVGEWESNAYLKPRHELTPEGPYELYTSIPSRPFFPRGFLWDEGFHLIPMAEWDLDLAMQIMQSWFGTMDADGWLPREQILGPEARSKVPTEFQVQYLHYAGPPTLFFIIDDLLSRLRPSHSGDIVSSYSPSQTRIRKYLHDIYPLLQRRFEWFRRTQKGDVKTWDRVAFSSKEAYRWRGRTLTHLLTSGLDDYPRPGVSPHVGELHVDLISWVGMMSHTLERIATALELTDDKAEYASITHAVRRNIFDLHWSEKDKAFCDATIDTDYEESQLGCFKGYISLFPFMLGHMDGQDEQMKHVLDLISDPEQLWSDHGIRSMSKQEPLYGTGENYWRGPIWMNMNYLIVKELHNLALNTKSPHARRAKSLYKQLRINLVDTVYKSWLETGFAWEQYNPDTGKGQRTKHFTGWTALVVKIMAMDDLSSNSDGKDEL